MKSGLRSGLTVFLGALLAAFIIVFPTVADIAVPENVLNPRTAPEAWDVIRLATANVAQLLKEKQLSEIPTQISLCSPALRVLAPSAPGLGEREALELLTARAFKSINAIAEGGLRGNPAGAEAAFASLKAVLAEMATHFDPEVANARISICPMHPDFISMDAATPCAKCGMALVPRRIPYSSVYMKPGEPTIRISARADAPLEAGRRAEVTVRLEMGDRSPVLPADLMVMHTQPIHLLIVDPTLGDYHHEHPVPTDVPGEYAFAFTPAHSSPYRIWADLVPVATGLQEYPSVDLPSKGEAEAIGDTADSFTSSAGGLKFTLALADGKGLALRAGELRVLSITVAEESGTPVKWLEPVMNAFAHLVGFYDDYETVVHLHPSGGDILDPDLRGGPAMGFKFYPPQAGFMRLYCQVSVEGKMVFAPFNVNILP